MRTVEGYRLWLGHVGDVRDLSGILSVGIEALVDLALNEPPLLLTRDLTYCRFPLVDGTGNPPWLLRTAVGVVTDFLHADVPTLIFCSAGLSRTPIIAAAAVAQLRGCSVSDALIAVVGSGPADVSPGLLIEVVAAMA